MTFVQLIGVIMVSFIAGAVVGIISAKQDEKEFHKQRLLKEKELLKGRGA